MCQKHHSNVAQTNVENLKQDQYLSHLKQQYPSNNVKKVKFILTHSDNRQKIENQDFEACINNLEEWYHGYTKFQPKLVQYEDDKIYEYVKVSSD